MGKEIRRKQNKEAKEKIDVLEYQNTLCLSTSEQQHVNEEALRTKLYYAEKSIDEVKKENTMHIEKIVKEKEEKWLNQKKQHENKIRTVENMFKEGTLL